MMHLYHIILLVGAFHNIDAALVDKIIIFTVSPMILGDLLIDPHFMSRKTFNVAQDKKSVCSINCQRLNYFEKLRNLSWTVFLNFCVNIWSGEVEIC